MPGRQGHARLDSATRTTVVGGIAGLSLVVAPAGPGANAAPLAPAGSQAVEEVQSDLVHGDVGQMPEQSDPLVGPLAPDEVENAKGSYRVALARDERDA